MRTTILATGRYTLTDADAIFLLGTPVSTGDAMTGAVLINGETREFPVVPGLKTKETDTMYGRLVPTPAGTVRVEDRMAIIAYDQKPCHNTHTQGPFWGVIDLAGDTELTWGPGWYQLAGQERVDLMVPQETALASFEIDGLGAEPITRAENEAAGFARCGFHNSSNRWLGDIEEVIAVARTRGLDDLVAKLERMESKGAIEVVEILAVQIPGDGRPEQRRPELDVVGMTGGSACLFGVTSLDVAA